MSEKISRREFLKLSGLSAAVTAVMTGCGPTSRYVVRRPYTDLPEYHQTGVSTYFATTCRECAAGCGIIMRTHEGRAIKAEGNPNHPVNRGKICSKGLTSVQGLYNPDRVKGPQQANPRGSGQFQAIDWDTAIGVVRDGLSNLGSAAFLLGSGSDHLFDLLTEVTGEGGNAVVRYSAEDMFSAESTLLQAVQNTFGQAAYPYFDLGNADLALSFGANFSQNWLSPIAYSRMYAQFRKGNFGRRGYLIAFEPHQSTSSSIADEWYPIVPGTEGLVALAIARLVVEFRAAAGFNALNAVNPAAAAEAAGIPLERLDHVARLFATARQPLALPGESALGTAQGLANAQAVLSLNAMANNLGAPGGVFLHAAEVQPHSMNQVAALVDRMRSGQVQTLFIHGVNPAFELPGALGFEQALQQVPRVISFASYPDETAMLSDYVLPDHTPLESWGYMRNLAGADRTVVSAVQPVVVPLHNTRATVDVLLEALRQAGGSPVNYNDEVDFLQQKLLPLLQEGGSIRAPEILTFWTQFLQSGGWWTRDTDLTTPQAEDLLGQAINIQPPQALAEDEFYLLAYAGMFGSGASANRPWMQETPEPLTTVMWNSVVQINPETAARLGLHNDDVVSITSAAGSIEAVVYEYPAIRPDMVAIPFGQGHTALGRWAEGRGANPAKLLGMDLNQAGDLAYYGGTRVKISPTGRRRPVSRLESEAGVYGHK